MIFNRWPLKLNVQNPDIHMVTVSRSQTFIVFTSSHSPIATNSRSTICRSLQFMCVMFTICKCVWVKVQSFMCAVHFIYIYKHIKCDAEIEQQKTHSPNEGACARSHKRKSKTALCIVLRDVQHFSNVFMHLDDRFSFRFRLRT